MVSQASIWWSTPDDHSDMTSNSTLVSGVKVQLLVGLHLFNNNTCPSGHISHPKGPTVKWDRAMRSSRYESYQSDHCGLPTSIRGNTRDDSNLTGNSTQWVTNLYRITRPSYMYCKWNQATSQITAVYRLPLEGIHGMTAIWPVTAHNESLTCIGSQDRAICINEIKLPVRSLRSTGFH